MKIIHPHIKNDREAKFWVSEARTNACKCKEQVDAIKRAIREYFNPHVSEVRDITTRDMGIYDQTLLLLPLPDYIKTEEEADTYFRQNLYLYYVPSAYDCTGQRFTAWFKVFKRGNRFWAYHCIHTDC